MHLCLKLVQVDITISGGTILNLWVTKINFFLMVIILSNTLRMGAILFLLNSSFLHQINNYSQLNGINHFKYVKSMTIMVIQQSIAFNMDIKFVIE